MWLLQGELGIQTMQLMRNAAAKELQLFSYLESDEKAGEALLVSLLNGSM
jgi:hypothetical protein